jgi:hypothetical protein
MKPEGEKKLRREESYLEGFQIIPPPHKKFSIFGVTFLLKQEYIYR